MVKKKHHYSCRNLQINILITAKFRQLTKTTLSFSDWHRFPQLTCTIQSHSCTHTVWTPVILAAKVFFATSLSCYQALYTVGMKSDNRERNMMKSLVVNLNGWFKVTLGKKERLYQNSGGGRNIKSNWHNVFFMLLLAWETNPMKQSWLLVPFTKQLSTFTKIFKLIFLQISIITDVSYWSSTPTSSKQKQGKDGGLKFLEEKKRPLSF